MRTAPDVQAEPDSSRSAAPARERPLVFGPLPQSEITSSLLDMTRIDMSFPVKTVSPFA